MSAQVLKISDVAKRLGVSPGTVRAYAEKGLIPVIKLPSGHRRFRESDVEDLRQKMGLDDINEDKEKA